MEFGDIEKKNKLKGAIVEAIAFFDLFDYPLTLSEVKKYLFFKSDLNNIFVGLESLIRQKIIETKRGFYFLPKRDEIIKIKMERYNYTELKIKRALWVSRIFKFIPWIKMIAVGNIIGAHNFKKEGDIDFFIITAKNRIYLTRFLCVSIIKSFNLRPRPGKEQDKICLSFFVSEEGMDLEKFKLNKEGGELKDIYFIFWLSDLLLIFDKDKVQKKFTEENIWLKTFLPNYQFYRINYRRDTGRSLSKIYYFTFDLFLGWAEKIIKIFQMKVLASEIKKLKNKDTRVIISDRTLKLHTRDRREEYLRKFKDKISKIMKDFYEDPKKNN